VLIIPLMEEPPWTRRRCVRVVSRHKNHSKDSKASSKMVEDGSNNNTMVWEKLMDNHQWTEIAPQDLLEVTKCEAACWFTLWFLTCPHQKCRERYGLTTFRKDQFLRVRKYMTEVLMDQLPMLKDMQRYMDELALTKVPDTSSGYGSSLLLQRVDVVRESILWNSRSSCNGDDDGHGAYSTSTGSARAKSAVSAGSPWEKVASVQMRDIFSSRQDTDTDTNHAATVDEDAEADILKRISDLYYAIEGDIEEEVLGEPPSSSTSTVNVNVDPLSQEVDKLRLVIYTTCRTSKDDKDDDDNKHKRLVDCMFVPDVVGTSSSSSSITQTDLGAFRRLKMVPSLLNNEGNNDSSGEDDMMVCCSADGDDDTTTMVEATIYFKDHNSAAAAMSSVTLEDELQLPPKKDDHVPVVSVVDHNNHHHGDTNKSISKTKKKKKKVHCWCQIGGKEHKLILQLGFVLVQGDGTGDGDGTGTGKDSGDDGSSEDVGGVVGKERTTGSHDGDDTPQYYKYQLKQVFFSHPA
jgi:hypothetical protein